MTSESLIRTVAIGKASVSDLIPLGVVIEGETPNRSIVIPAKLPEVRVSPSELSAGLLAARARGADLATWAFVTRELVLLDGEDSPEWEALVNTLSSAATGEGVPDAALVLARSMALPVVTLPAIGGSEEVQPPCLGEHSLALT